MTRSHKQRALIVVRFLTFTFFFVAGLLPVAAFADETKPAEEPFFLYKDGKATATIVITKPLPVPGAHEMVKAIETFRLDVYDGFGVDIPFGVTHGGPNRVELAVEERPLETEDEVVIDFPSENVMRITGGLSGVRRTLFFILEEFGGVRYLYQGGEKGFHFPKRTELAIPRKTIKRNSCYPYGRMSGKTSAWMGPYPSHRRYYWFWEVRLGAKAVLRYNHALTSGPEPSRKWNKRLYEICFPLREYRDADEKPSDEMFPILHGKRYLPYKDLAPGKKAPQHWQPCFTSTEAVDEAATNLIEFLERNPGIRSLSLGVNDCGGHCECERCLAMDKVNGDSTNRSESYYHWVNQVAERVGERFPDVKFGVIAYREVLDPPTFKLHSSVVPVLCFDFNAVIDPEMEKTRKRLVEKWSEKADHIGFWAYDPGFYCFTLPRVYFTEQQKMIQFIRDHHGSLGFSSGGYYFTANEGPKAYLAFKLMENPDLDLEATIMDWCRACVGDEAAPHLRGYYKFWEDFWRTKATKTAWWESRRNVYLMRKYFGTYMYGLEPGDMAKCRKIMEKVVELADKSGSDDQKTRAALQMRCFEWHEAAAKVCAAENIGPDGKIPDAAAAAKLLASIPEALENFEKFKSIPKKMKNWYAYNLVLNRADAGVVLDLLVAASEFVDDPAVRDELRKLSENKTLDANIRFLVNVMLKGDAASKSGNLIPDGGFEKSDDHGFKTTHPVHGTITRVDDVASEGGHSLKCDIKHHWFTAEKFIPNTKPGTNYYFSARFLVPKDQPANLEGRLLFWGNPALDGRNRTWPASIPEIRLPTGKWTYVNAIVPSHSKANSTMLRFRLKNFEKDAVVYVDDMKLFEVPEERP